MQIKQKIIKIYNFLNRIKKFILFFKKKLNFSIKKIIRCINSNYLISNQEDKELYKIIYFKNLKN